jgi:hypothetical protein
MPAGMEPPSLSDAIRATLEELPTRSSESMLMNPPALAGCVGSKLIGLTRTSDVDSYKGVCREE